MVDEYDCRPGGADESWHGVFVVGDVVTAVAVEAGVGEAAGDAVDDGQRGGVGVVEGLAPAVEAGGAAGLGAGGGRSGSEPLSARRSRRAGMGRLIHVARAVLVVDAEDDIMAALEFLCGGDPGDHAFAAAGFAVQVVLPRPIEEALAVLASEHGSAWAAVQCRSELGEVFELPAGGGVFVAS